MNRWVVNIVVAMAGLLAVGTPTPALAAPPSPNLVVNPSFEQLPGGRPTCWVLGGELAQASKLTVTDQAHSGSAAMRVADQRSKTGRISLNLNRAPGCAVTVVYGHSYTLSIWYRSSAPARLETELRLGGGTWSGWRTRADLPASASWTMAKLDTPAVPEGATLLSFGLSIPASSWFVADDASVIDTTPPGATGGGKVIFHPAFATRSSVVTNEYAYWNANHRDKVASPDWEMTSGSLFSLDGGGYSGAVNTGGVDAQSVRRTNSAIFRLNTRRYDFGDVQVGLKADIRELSKTATTPAADYDGVHIWLRYQSQYQLYVASIARRDGRLTIKKKCPGGTSNDGTYYDLTKEITGYPIQIDRWWSVAASVRNNRDGSVTIVMFQDGTPVMSATDTGVGCAPITKPGAVGVRGDNVRFQFTDFTVTTV